MDMNPATDRQAPRKREVAILLAEDDDGDAKAIRRAFAKARIANPMHRVLDGEEALDWLRVRIKEGTAETPVILLADLNMPRMGGIDLVRAIRADPALRPTVIFILTTSKTLDDKIAAYNLNVAGYIVKETAGEDFLALTDLLQSYWRIVEML